MMKPVSFVVDAKHYFEADADKLAQVKNGDLVLVEIDFENEKANYTWYPSGENPANFPAEDDDFDGVVNFLASFLSYTDQNGGVYELEIQADSDCVQVIQVIIDYELKKKVGDLHPIGRHCVFNKAYKEFSIKQLVKDLREQHHEELADHIRDSIK